MPDLDPNASGGSSSSSESGGSDEHYKTGLIPNTFEWNGRNCSYYGIVMLSPPTIMVPKERYSSVTIPGRAGSIVVKENDYVYDNIQMSCTCIVLNLDKINQIASWLRGSGLLRIANRGDFGLDRYYRARIANQISFDKVLRGNKHRTFTIQFDCEPFTYIGDPEQSENYYQTENEDELTINNEVVTSVGVMIAPVYSSIVDYSERFYSEPKMKFTFVQTNTSASTDIKIYVYNKSYEVVSTTTILYNKLYNPSTGKRRKHYMFLDSETKIAYYDDENLSYMVAGDWPTLPPDLLCVLVDSHLVSSVEFTPRWRALV